MQVRDGLGERKLKILHAIIQNYLETGEPVAPGPFPNTRT